MMVFLATLIIFSIVIVLMSVMHLAGQRAAERKGNCASHCPGCVQTGRDKKGG